ncbi:glutamine--tRNA ligase/YqeY domain fusion protein [Gilvimarinus agarilyticus]|uniref:glutamine--tRNA ligase/YqeY domain fusion protein n=1 Tax=Gilvimarinus sp. 2_MG-2023 TaxID=3062666 RepID=UPI001C09D2F2|nr:glutamine--tRNA ligase/YqeY domain fusion protein [Gilvimarinus sp. 2_MG-2023]MBU2887051.1 glutamine--tRNA ligase/YqeY domain fusion protein [Gilvimarinus agarilyticus]MDO6571711.1 glutamine--tRNA ligase/YqeY domain fusion protein [Gilvimarinus sp. 2_MG-2023]
MSDNPVAEKNAVEKPAHFLQNIIKADLSAGQVGAIVTRFPPEPNGYLHIGHAKSICLNFGLAKEFGGQCNLRFDDTNPAKESDEYVEAIKKDVSWLGFQWAGDICFTSNYFDQLYAWALDLIRAGKAYVCDLSPDQAREHRGTLKEPGKNSPFRERSVDENLALFEKMRSGEMPEGSCSLRAKIDMAAPNINMRDPILYRIKHVSHHHTGDKWCIYPSYDFAHGQSDALEGVTHSICTLEFEDHRPLYEWFIENLPVPAAPKQYEFARLNLNYTITSKRKLLQLVEDGHVDGWDDPRMPTISGMRRRGYTPASLRNFCERIGVTRSDSVVDVGMLEFCVRDDLDKNAPRAMCVLRPLKVTLTNYDEGKTQTLTAPGHPNRDDLPVRELTFSKTLYIDCEDFREEANKKYKRLVIGKRVRLRNAYVIEADECVKDSAGNIVEVKARIIDDTIGKDPADGVKPKGVIHWVSDSNHIDCEVRLYDRLFQDENPGAGGSDFLECINPNSLEVLTGCKAEPSLADAQSEAPYQFEREGYFCFDETYSQQAGKPVFNRTISLRDSWAKISQQ